MAKKAVRQTDFSALSGCFAPRFWPTRVAAAFAIPHAGNMVKINTRIPIVYPASASLPNCAMIRIRKTHDAEAIELERLETERDGWGTDWDRAFELNNNLWEVLFPDSNDWTHGSLEDFWKETLGVDEFTAKDGLFSWNFANGALSVWYEVKNQI